MKFSKSTAFAVGFLLIITSCDTPAGSKESPSGLPYQTEDVELEKVEESKFSPQGTANDNIAADSSIQTQQFHPPHIPFNQTPPQTIDWNKKIIKTAVLNIEVKDFRIFNQEIRKNIQQFGGYISQEEQNESENKIENIVTIKVPVDQFDNCVTQIANEPKNLLEKKITSEDVTKDVIDTKSRMEAKKHIRQRYLDLLQQAKNMEEILQIQEEINETQVDIESAAGRIEQLKQASAYSTIHLTYFQILSDSIRTDGKPSFFDKFLTAFRNGGKWAGELLLLFITLWPLWIFIGSVIIIYRQIRTPKVKPVS